jgi:hypothetical protein
MRRFAIWLLAITGCSSNPSTPAEFRRRDVDAVCAWKTRCGAIGRSEESACKAQGYEYFDKFWVITERYDVNEAVAAKRLEFDSSAANACVDAHRTLLCTGLDLVKVSPCLSVFRGRVAIGGECQSPGECSSGYCLWASGTGSCGGTCTEFLAEGASCTDWSCNPAQDFCSVSNVCVPLGADGAACSPGRNQCQDGLVCDGSICSKPPEEGQACVASVGCVNGLYCPRLGTPVCTATVGSGQACTDHSACPQGQRCAGAPNGTCADVLDVGARCDPMAHACPASAPCDPATGMCTNRGREGTDCSTSSCQPSQWLAPPYFCDTTTMKCTQRLLPPGQACAVVTQSNDPCATFCDPSGGACRAAFSFCE